MTARYAISGIFAALVSLSTCQLALATDCDSPAIPGKKPAIDAYADYSDFLVAIMDFKSRSRTRAAQKAACPELFATPSDLGTLDPTVTYGPETLESATARTEQLKPSIYPIGKTWYQRSTSSSFALPSLAAAQMDHQGITTHLRTLIDAPIPERDRQLALNILGPLPDDDGHWGPSIAERQLHDDLSEKERGPGLAIARSDLPYDGIHTDYLDNGGYLRIYFKAGEITQVHALIHAGLGSL